MGHFPSAFFSVLCLLTLLWLSAVPARAATDVPEGLSAADWQAIREQLAVAVQQQAYLKASNTKPVDGFGHAVAVSGDTVVVGAPLTDAAYVFVRRDNTWNQQAYFKDSNIDAHDWFGLSVAVSGDTIVVGSYGEGSNAGAAYVFVRSGDTWSQQAYLKASNTDADDRFGWSVAVSGDTVVVGAQFESSIATGVNSNQDDNSAFGAGAAYVFVRSGNTWSQQAYLKASNTDADDYFGSAIAVDGDTVVVGAWREASNATRVNGDQSDNSAFFSGAAYVFVRNGDTWSQQAYLKASNTDADDGFGGSVAVSGDTVVVGAGGEASNATGVNGDQGNDSATGAGAAYIFVRNGSTWTQQAYIKASNTDEYDRFGSVAISGDTVVVGAGGEASNATGVNGDQGNDSATGAGAAYIFVRNGSTWTQQAYIKASNTNAVDEFGIDVAVSSDTVVVGSRGEDSAATGVNGDQNDNSASSAGAAYVFTLTPAAILDPNPIPTLTPAALLLLLTGLVLLAGRQLRRR